MATAIPGFLFSGAIPLQRKLEFVPDMALFWCSADSVYGGVDWGFAVTLSDLLRFVLLSLLFGLYFALVFRYRDRAAAERSTSKLGRGGGASGARRALGSDGRMHGHGLRRAR
jgi:hypothetical protein